jgi:hypothetical protein
VTAAIKERYKRYAKEPKFVTPILFIEAEIFLHHFYLGQITLGLTSGGT